MIGHCAQADSQLSDHCQTLALASQCVLLLLALSASRLCVGPVCSGDGDTAFAHTLAAHSHCCYLRC